MDFQKRRLLSYHQFLLEILFLLVLLYKALFNTSNPPPDEIVPKKSFTSSIFYNDPDYEKTEYILLGRVHTKGKRTNDR